MLAQQIIFFLCSAVAICFFSKKIISIRRNILLGRDETLNDNPNQRLRNMIVFALGQKKMFTNPTVAFLHFIVYAGFIIINAEILEIFLDGLFGTHRLFAPLLGDLYSILINSFEILAVLVLVSCVMFLIRRNLIKVNRFTKPELKGFPLKDANIILFTEIILMSLFLKMNAADQLLQTRGIEHYTATSHFFISSLVAELMQGYSTSTLIFTERACWWIHILGIFAFLNYLPYSKHLHIVLAFPNSYFARLENIGKMENMPLVQKEVTLMFQPERANEFPSDDAPVKFGAKDVKDLSWKNLMDAYSCSECGRCTAACPANQTGKKLSPRKIMMDTRDRIEEVGNNIDKHGLDFTDNKTLLGDYITVEELRACTTCNACVQECPINISPLNIIVQLRRSLVMEDSNVPNEWAMMFGNIENNMAPWKFSNEERANWRNS
jgi:heterodisulfide reductase subunit C